MKGIAESQKVLTTVTALGNLKELLAPSNPYKPNKLEGQGCYKCDA
jgi:hypothetical protein